MRKYAIVKAAVSFATALAFVPLSVGATGAIGAAATVAKEKCWMCGGKGKVVPTCSKCRGTGKGQGFDTTMMGKCTKCKGKPLPKEKCDNCKGKGKI
jgi:DnaJ-class molecular chaperone